MQINQEKLFEKLKEIPIGTPINEDIPQTPHTTNINIVRINIAGLTILIALLTILLTISIGTLTYITIPNQINQINK